MIINFFFQMVDWLCNSLLHELAIFAGYEIDFYFKNHHFFSLKLHLVLFGSF